MDARRHTISDWDEEEQKRHRRQGFRDDGSNGSGGHQQRHQSNEKEGFGDDESGGEQLRHG